MGPFPISILVSHSIPLLEWPTPDGTLGSTAGRNRVTKVNPCPYEDWSIQWKRRQGSNLKVFIRELSFRLCRSQLRSNHFKSILLPAYGPTAFLYVWLVGFTYLASLSNGRWVLTVPRPCHLQLWSLAKTGGGKVLATWLLCVCSADGSHVWL